MRFEDELDSWIKLHYRIATVEKGICIDKLTGGQISDWKVCITASGAKYWNTNFEFTHRKPCTLYLLYNGILHVIKACNNGCFINLF